MIFRKRTILIKYIEENNYINKGYCGKLRTLGIKNIAENNYINKGYCGK